MFLKGDKSTKKTIKNVNKMNKEIKVFHRGPRPSALQLKVFRTQTRGRGGGSAGVRTTNRGLKSERGGGQKVAANLQLEG